MCGRWLLRFEFQGCLIPHGIYTEGNKGQVLTRPGSGSTAVVLVIC